METILLIPEYSHELRGSLLHICQRLMRTAASRDDVRLVVPYPAEGSRWKGWTPQKWEVEAPNLEFVPVLMDKYSESPLGRISSDWACSKFGGRKDYQVVATFRSTSTLSIKRLFSKPMVGFYPEVVNLYGIGDCEYFKSLMPDLPDEILFQCMLSWNIIFGTTGFGEHMSRQFGTLFNPSVCRRVKERTDTLAIGVDIGRLRRVVPMQKPEGKIRIAYGGRFIACKGVEAQVEAVEKLYAAGMNVELGLYLVFDRRPQENDKLDWLRSKPFVRLEINQDPIDEHFWAYAKSADLFMYFDTMANYGLMPLELLAMGVPGLFVKQPNVRGMVPDDYPLVFDSKAEMFQQLRQACRRVEAGNRVVDMDPVVSFVEKHHNRDVFDSAVLDRLIRLSRLRNARVRPKSWSEVLV